MAKKTWAKIFVIVFVTAALSFGLYVRWQSSSWDPGWGKGNLTTSERTYYFGRINRIIESWRQTKRNAERERDGRLKDSYNTYLVIDLDKKALWMENNGRISKADYVEFPPETKWTLRRYISTGSTLLRGRTVLKIRGYSTDKMIPERFVLVGSGAGSYIHFQFDSNSGGGGSGTGSFNKPSISFKSSSANEDELYGSIIVTSDEYQQYRNSIAESNTLQADGEKSQPQVFSGLEANKAAWNRIEKNLYMEIDRQVQAARYQLYTLTVEPGPDFSAGHAELRARGRGFIKQFVSGSNSVESYLQIDDLGNDIWYAKSAPDPQRPRLFRRQLDLEFLICFAGDISESQHKKLIKQGRQKQKFASVPESKWKAVIPDEASIEFIGICENPSAGKKWWGPDGSLLDFVPYINTEPYDIPREDRKMYEFAWRIIMLGGGGATTYHFEGSNGSYSRQILDRYGNSIRGNLNASGQAFDPSRQMTTWKVGLTDDNWQTALVVEDKAGEINFLGKQRIVLNPPVIENGQIVVRSYEEYRSRVREYQTDFGLIIHEDSTTKTIYLGRYREETTDDKDTGLTEHKFVIDDLSLGQIEGVCFRYCPYRFVTFKNISLVPGQNMGFSLELEGQ
jgi:hypothetical protein